MVTRFFLSFEGLQCMQWVINAALPHADQRPGRVLAHAPAEDEGFMAHLWMVMSNDRTFVPLHLNVPSGSSSTS